MDKPEQIAIDLPGSSNMGTDGNNFATVTKSFKEAYDKTKEVKKSVGTKTLSEAPKQTAGRDGREGREGAQKEGNHEEEEGSGKQEFEKEERSESAESAERSESSESSEDEDEESGNQEKSCEGFEDEERSEYEESSAVAGSVVEEEGSHNDSERRFNDEETKYSNLRSRRESVNLRSHGSASSFKEVTDNDYIDVDYKPTWLSNDQQFSKLKMMLVSKIEKQIIAVKTRKSSSLSGVGKTIDAFINGQQLYEFKVHVREFLMEVFGIEFGHNGFTNMLRAYAGAMGKTWEPKHPARLQEPIERVCDIFRARKLIRNTAKEALELAMLFFDVKVPSSQVQSSQVPSSQSSHKKAVEKKGDSKKRGREEGSVEVDAGRQKAIREKAVVGQAKKAKNVEAKNVEAKNVKAKTIEVKNVEAKIVEAKTIEIKNPKKMVGADKYNIFHLSGVSSDAIFNAADEVQPEVQQRKEVQEFQEVQEQNIEEQNGYGKETPGDVPERLYNNFTSEIELRKANNLLLNRIKELEDKVRDLELRNVTLVRHYEVSFRFLKENFMSMPRL